MSRSTLGYAAAFVVLAVLVEVTDFDRLNQFALDHLQPIAQGKGHGTCTPGRAGDQSGRAGHRGGADRAGGGVLGRAAARPAVAWPAALAAAW